MSTDKFFIITGTNLIMGLENIIDWSRISSFHHDALFFLFVFVSFITLLVKYEIDKLIKYYPIK
jgi:hypothetical protein